MTGGLTLESDLVPVDMAAEARPAPPGYACPRRSQRLLGHKLFQVSQSHRPKEKQVETGLAPPPPSVPSSWLRSATILPQFVA